MQQSGAGGGRGCALLPLLGVLLFQGVYTALSLEIKADAHVRGYVGEKIKLKCTFRSTSSITDKLTIDWTYRPPSSSRTESIFHYQSFQYPTTAGTFRDRISWAGDVYRGDASISISNPTLKDNGTFSCAVKNPPDVHHNIPVTELTVTERGFGIMLSSVALLSVLVFVPSAVVVVLLLVRMGRKSAGLKKRNKSGYKKSSIEVSDEPSLVLPRSTRGKSTEEKRVTKVDWMFSSGEHAKDDYVLYYYANLSVPVGRFQNRVRLVGDISRSDGSLLLQNVEEADQGTYTCEIRLEMESLVFKKAVVLHVLPEESKELMAHVGDSTQLGCVLQSTGEKRMTKVDWTFSSGEHAEEEVMLRYHSKLRVPVGNPQNRGRFQNRVTLVGDTSRNDASIMLQGVRESDRGSYTCSIHLGNLTFKKTTVLHVILKEPRTLVTPAALKPEILGGNQLVIIVGIVCGTILLLPVLILIVKNTHRNTSSGTSTTLVKSLENIQKADPEKHVYSSITTRELIEEEESSGRAEATYMTMHPVWPSLRSAPNNPPEEKSAGGIPKPEQAF